MLIYIPYKINFLLINSNITKKKYIIIYNKADYCVLYVKEIKGYKNITFITINKNVYNLNYAQTIISYINNYHNFYIQKIKFKGKGYKISKKKNFLILNFNHSHIIFALLFNIKCVKINKNTYEIILKNFLKLKTFIKKLIKIKYINVYTKRGIRLAKQNVYKKIGKRT